VCSSDLRERLGGLGRGLPLAGAGGSHTRAGVGPRPRGVWRDPAGRGKRGKTARLLVDHDSCGEGVSTPLVRPTAPPVRSPHSVRSIGRQFLIPSAKLAFAHTADNEAAFDGPRPRPQGTDCCVA